MNNAFLQAGATAIICIAIMLVCICRLDKIGKDVLLRVGIQYVFLLMAAAGLALAPFFWQFPGWTVVIFAAAVLFMLLADSFQWRHGPPEGTTGPVPLSDF